MQHVILGTAGHIDHGKSSLVKALTGIDPDRLKEEKERGITIDLGFADLKYPDGLTVGIIDVPGHEKLIRNMLAGAGGIDLVLFVIAADEGIMPQSREHLAICNLLKIQSGLIVITKTDLVEKEWLELVTIEVRDFVKDSFLDSAEIIQVSSKSGHNIGLLKEKIRAAALKIRPKSVKEILRLPIDRVFTLKGFGTVITGTLISGSVSTDDMVEVLPSGITGKVRGLHSHGMAIQTAYAGQRIGMNLQGVEKDSLKRGDTVVLSESVVPTRTIDVKIELLSNAQPLKSKSLLHLHISTSETVARVILYDRDSLEPGESCYCQLRLNEPVVSLSGDRFVIRKISPVITIGGGVVLDPSPVRRRRKDGIEDLRVIDTGALQEKIEMKIKKAGLYGIDQQAIAGWIRAETPLIEDSIKQLKTAQKVIGFEHRLLHQDSCNVISAAIKTSLSGFHKKNPLSPGMPKEELKAQAGVSPDIWNALLKTVADIIVDKELVRLTSFKAASSGASQTSQRILDLLEKAGFLPPIKEELAEALAIPQKELNDMLKLMSKEGKLIRISDSIHVTSGVYTRMMSQLKAFYQKQQTMTVAEFRDLLGTSRKYALPFLEYMDSNKITLRVGDARKLLLK